MINCIIVGFSFNPKDIERDFHKFDFNKDGNWQLEEVLLSFDHIDIDGKMVIFQR